MMKRMTQPPPQSAAPTSPAPAARGPLAATCLRAWIVFALIAISVTVGDLCFKSWAFEHVAGEPVFLTRENAATASRDGTIPPHAPIVVVPYVLSLTLTTNPGAVFGLGKGAQTFFIIVSVLATGAIVAMFARSEKKAWLFHVCLALILGGAWGNLYDRAVFNAVRDMLLMLPQTKLWPWIFNIADVCLVVGVSVLVVILWRGERQQQIDQKSPS